MATEDFAEYISLAEAAKEYKTTRTYWYDQIKAEKITAYELPGRRGTFFLRAELVAFWKPRPKDLKQDETA